MPTRIQAVLDYLKRALLVLVVSTIVFVPTFFPPLLYMRNWLKRVSGWNWAWPSILFLVTLLLFKVLGVDREKITNLRRAFMGIGFVVVFRFLSAGVPAFEIPTHQILFLVFQFFVSFAEELYFRGWALDYLKTKEMKFHRKETDQFGFCPISISIVSVVFAVMHGLNPVLLGAGVFDWSWFRMTFGSSMLFTFFYLITGTIWAPVLVHFFENTYAVFWPS